MIKIRSVCAVNFRSYPKFSFEIPERGIILLDGQDLRTRGSNGSGKSTLCDSIFWCIYGYLPRGGLADAVIRNGESHCSVSLELQVNNEQWIIVRSRGPNKLEVTIDGKPEKRKAADLQQFIQSKLKSPDLFEISAYIAQDRSTGFYNMTDGDRADIFSILANAKEMELGHEVAKAERDLIKSKLIASKASFETMRAFVADTQIRLSKLQGGFEEARRLPEFTKQQIEKTRKHNDALAEQIKKEASEKHNKLYGDLSQKITELSDLSRRLTRRGEVIQKDLAEIKAPSDELKALEKKYIEASQILEAAKSHNKLAQKGILHNQKLQVQIEHKRTHATEMSDKGTCNACGQLLPEATRADAMMKSVQEIEKLQGQLMREPELIDEASLHKIANDLFSDYSLKKAAAEEAPNRLMAELKAQRAELDSVNSQIQRLKAECDTYLARLKNDTDQKLKKLDEDILALERTLEMQLQKVDALAKQLSDEQAALVAHAEKTEKLDGEIKHLEDELVLYGELLELFGNAGYRAVQFSDLVTRVSELAGSYLEHMTGGQYSTRIEQVKENGKGEARIVLRPVVTRGGIETTEFDSGGQRGRVRLAYDLAVNAVGADGLPLILDEALNGLDSEAKFEALDLLKQISLDRPIFVIDHTDALKTALDICWVVQRDTDGNSILIK